jgi:predicted NUDIX family phosphoesterase
MEVKKERVAVFPAANVEHFEDLPGYGDSEINFEQFRLMLETCISFRERSEVEEDEEWKQLIPYTYVFDPASDSVLVYRRAESGGDARLAGKWSLGFGGHINPTDDRLGRVRMLDIATNRELQEELIFHTPYDAPATMGFLYLEKTPVDRVHFGVVRQALYRGDHGDIQHNEEIAEMKWVQVSDLDQYEFEGWSEVLVTAVLRSRA